MGCVGQIFTSVTWVEVLFSWIIIFTWFAWVKIFCGGLNFCVSDFLGAVGGVGGKGEFLKISKLALSLLVLSEF